MSEVPVALTIDDDGVATVLIDNPPANAMSKAVLEGLAAHIEALSEDATARAVVIASTGSKVFASGADITELPELLAGEGELADRLAWVGRIFSRLVELPQPVIAAISGDAAGGGLELAMACDLIVVGRDSRFSLPEVRLGLIPGAGGTQRLPRRIGIQRAREMILLGTPLTADEALDAGLANLVVAPEEVLDSARELAARLAAMPWVAVSAAKRTISEGEGLPMEDALENERVQFLRVSSSADAAEGCRAFLERRKPVFEHK